MTAPHIEGSSSRRSLLYLVFVLSIRKMTIVISWLIFTLPMLGYQVYGKLVDWIRAVKLTSSIPGPPILPIIGNSFVPKNNKDIIEMLSTAHDKYGSIVRGWLAFNPIIFIYEPKHVQVILRSSKLVDKELLYNVMSGIVGNGLIVKSGNNWRYFRKCIQPHFNITNLQNYIPSFVECSKILAESLKNVKEVKITSPVNNYIAAVAHEIVLGVPVSDYKTMKESPFTKGRNTAINRLESSLLVFDSVFKVTKMSKVEVLQSEAWFKFISKLFKNIKNNINGNEVSNRSILSYFVRLSESDKNFHEEDVIQEACSFMLAGQDSSAVTLSIALYYIAKYQDFQDKIAEEINLVFSHSDEVNMETVNQMKYLEQCIKESMRISPAVPLIARKLNKDIEIDKYVIPRGCNVFISSYTTHRLPHHYPEPEKFDPERFSEENQQTRHSFAFIPFSAGPRICIANKLIMIGMKIAIASILKNFKIHLAPGHEQLFPAFRMTLKAKGNIWLRLEPRGPLN